MVSAERQVREAVRFDYCDLFFRIRTLNLAKLRTWIKRLDNLVVRIASQKDNCAGCQQSDLLLENAVLQAQDGFLVRGVDHPRAIVEHEEIQPEHTSSCAMFASLFEDPL